MRLHENQKKALRKRLLELVFEKKSAFIKQVADEFGISRQMVSRYLSSLVKEGLVVQEGRGRGTSYQLVETKRHFNGQVDELDENRVWLDEIKPYLERYELPQNVMDICHYGTTEMLNNIYEHAAANKYYGMVSVNALSVTILVADDGIGIFNKIKKEFGLAEPREAIIELSKGKLTTDEQHHTGEGIFFTSRMMDEFSILSGKLSFQTRRGEDWLLETSNRTEGTRIIMKIRRESDRTVEEVFDRYTSFGELAFTKTVVPVALLAGEDKAVFSRSQAKRLVWRFERFKEIVLDFNGVRTIGQAFADEVFRVFANNHPDINLSWAHANRWVERMIKRSQDTENI
jgi:anti-sigma regulatory factor (Ser/Thr protein kinase)/biotin operon repressor